MPNNNPIKFSDLIMPDDSIKKAITELNELIDTFNFAQKEINKNAISVQASLKGVNSATATGRKEISEQTKAAEKLAKAQAELTFLQSDAGKELARLNALRREQANINKLAYKQETELAGSYNQLSAQYSLNKLALNALSIAEREATEYGRELVKETNEIYEEMKRLQAETGKTSLNVGNYADAGKNLTTVLRDNVRELAQLRLNGEQSSASYIKLAQETAVLEDALADTRAEIKNMASDTAQLDAVLQFASAAGGGFAAFTGAFELFGNKSEDVQKAQKKLQAAIAITTGLQAIQNAVQKQSAIMLQIQTIQSYAAAKAEAYRRLITIQGTAATTNATIAQAAFNAVANANPYVLLATALLTVIGAFVIFSRDTNKAADIQKKLNSYQQRYLELVEQEGNKLVETSDKRVRAAENELAIAKARNESVEEIQRLEDKLASERRRAHNLLVGYYGEELDGIDSNKKKLEEYRKALRKLNDLKLEGATNITWNVELDDKFSELDIEDALTIAQQKIDLYGKKVQIGVQLESQGIELQVEEIIRLAERQKQQREAYRAELQLLRASEDSKNRLIKNSYEQQRVTLNASYSRQIQDLQYQLKTDNALTKRGRAAINQTIVNLRNELKNELVNIANEEAAQLLAIERRTEDLRLALLSNGADKQRRQLQVVYSRQIEDLKIQLKTVQGLTEAQINAILDQILLLEEGYKKDLQELNAQIAIQQLQAEEQRLTIRLNAVRQGSEEEIKLRQKLLQKQRDIELAQNRLLAEELRQSEADINASYDAQYLRLSQELSNERALLMFDRLQELAESEFNLLRNSEERKTRFRLKAERDRLMKVLELNEKNAEKLSDIEVKTIQNTIKRIDNEIKKSNLNERSSNLLSLVGINLDQDQKDAISTSIDFVIGQLNKLAQARVNAAQKAVNAYKSELDAARDAYKAEIEARNNGYAHSVSIAQKELALAQENYNKANEEQEKAQKKQERLNELQQISSLVTASALIWSQLGFPFAIPAIAAMFASYAAVKIKSKQLAKSNGSESFGEGMAEFVGGGSHVSGNDTVMGVNPENGKTRKVEAGEFLSVIRRKYAQGKYKSILPALFNSLNNGTFEEKFINSMDPVRSVNIEPTNTRNIESSLNAIKNKQSKNVYLSGGRTIIVTGSNTKRIKHV